MLLKFICCDVFTRMACDMIAKSPHTIDVEFIQMLSHDQPDVLRKELQDRINKSVQLKQYDKLILGYGLCGNSIAGLSSPIPMIIPKMHDCCTMFMGSKDNYLKAFGNSLSMRWCTSGYFERCYAMTNSLDGAHMVGYKTTPEYLQLVEEYDEENAQYIWDTLHPALELKEAAYIEIDGYEVNDTLSHYKKLIEETGSDLKILKGDTSFFEKLVNGPWDSDFFLEVLPGEKVVANYDMDNVISASR